MPLPLILGIGAAIAGIAGVGSGISGAAKMKEANDTMEAANRRNERNRAELKESEKNTSNALEKLGKTEVEILTSFSKLFTTIEKIKNIEEEEILEQEKCEIPECSLKELKDISLGASVLLGGLGGAATGTAAAFAASGATTAAVMALGTASTGTAIASLSGVAATNATLAALGGGALAAGGGGIALGTAVLGAATLGVGLLLGGVIFNATGSSLTKNADKAWDEMKENEERINRICKILQEIENSASKYIERLSLVDKVYELFYNKLFNIVEEKGKTDYKKFTPEEKLILKNSFSSAKLLKYMCQVQFLVTSDSKDTPNKLNTEKIEESLDGAEKGLLELGYRIIQRKEEP